MLAPQPDSEGTHQRSLKFVENWVAPAAGPRAIPAHTRAAFAQRINLLFVTARCQTRRRYSPVRVSISILSPVETKSGTCTWKPLAIFAGFITLPDVSPLTAGSV